MGSTGRKRSADQQSMDGSMSMSMSMSTTETATKPSRTGRKKKDKKSKIHTKTKEDLVAVKGGGRNANNNKSNKSNTNKDGGTTKDGSSSLETTATAEGKQMAQVLSTFSKLEQSRFEAFRKASFPGDAIARYVAHCLIHEQHRPVSNCSSSAAARHLRPTKGRTRGSRLSEVVAPGQAGDITVVVSTLAKEYAQRLVLAARRHCGNQKIAPEHVLKALGERTATGLDPGFFLSSSSSSTREQHDPQTDALKRSVALAAQDAYDEDQKRLDDETKAVDEHNNNNNNDDDEMEIDAEEEDGMDTMDNDGETKSDDDDDDDENPSDSAVRLFALHVNRMIARQHGITIVTSDDDDDETTKKPADANANTKPDTTSSIEERSPTNKEAVPMDTSSDSAAAPIPEPSVAAAATPAAMTAEETKPTEAATTTAAEETKSTEPTTIAVAAPPSTIDLSSSSEEPPQEESKVQEMNQDVPTMAPPPANTD